MAISFGDQVFLQHVAQVGAHCVHGVAASREDLRIEVRLTAKLADSLGRQICMTLFVGRVLKELGRGSRSVHADRRVVVALITKHAHEFCREHLIEDIDNALDVVAVGGCHCAPVHLLARVGTDPVEVEREFVHSGVLFQVWMLRGRSACFACDKNSGASQPQAVPVIKESGV